jgi:hypothetical protein
MFIENKYFKWYTQIIDSSHNPSNHEYYEKHHIIPKSMGGSNYITNIAKLSARQHYICHWLLTKCVKKQHKFKMIAAFHRMNNKRSKCRINSKAYEVNKKNFSIAMSEFQKNYIKTPEHLEKIASKKRGKPLSDNLRKNLSIIKIGVKLSIEHKANISKGLLGNVRGSYEKIICPHCNSIVGGKGNFKRWHGDNCKAKT